MNRYILALVVACGAVATFATRSFAADDCRKEYVVPYAEQCNYAYTTLKKDTSPANLSAAFAACGRAQNFAVSCVTSSDRGLHAVALGALYRDVTQQAEIAMFAQQFSVARALLHEKIQVLDAIAKDERHPDPTLARERAATSIDIADAVAGACTTRAAASAGRQRELGRAHKYGDLADLLKGRAQAYALCAKLATTPAKRAYVQYVGLVAIEESGRASQAAGRRRDANELYRICIAGAQRVARTASPTVKAYLATVATLCAGRASGRYSTDQPERLDAVATTSFKPLTLPHAR